MRGLDKAARPDRERVVPPAQEDRTSPGAVGPITRRGFLRAGFWGTAALGVFSAASGCTSASQYRERIGRERPEVLTAKELAVLMAIADRVITPAEGCPTAAEARVARRIDRELVFSDGKLAADVRASLALLEHGPLLDLRFRRLTRLAPAEQDEVLRGCLESSWALRRNAFNGIRFLCLFFYYTDDRTWRSIGYDGPTVQRKLPEAANAIETLDSTLREART